MNIFNVRHSKVGGIRFLRIGRLQFSFCLCRGFEQKPKRKGIRPALDGVKYFRQYEGGSTAVVYHDR